MVGQVRTSNPGKPRINSGESNRNKDLIQKGPLALGSVATFEPGSTGTLSYEHKQPVPPQVMRMLSRLMEREVTIDDSNGQSPWHR